MKYMWMGLMAVAMHLGVTALAEGQPTDPPTKEVVVGINDAFIPSGFDSSSDAYVVVNGLFPNSCYRFKGADIEHTTATLHQIKVKATVSQGMCLMVLVPYSKDIQLGRLATGTHTLRFVSGDGTYMEKKLTVE